jgi:hypothetical protein
LKIKKYEPGNYETEINADDYELASGVYFYVKDRKNGRWQRDIY